MAWKKSTSSYSGDLRAGAGSPTSLVYLAKWGLILGFGWGTVMTMFW